MKIVKAASLALASLVVVGLSTGAAFAVTVINFASPGSLASGVGSSSGIFSQDGITGLVYADGGCIWCNPVITQDALEGLGVSSHFLDDPALDGALTWESLSFSFNSTVELLSITFGWLDNEDDWSIEVGDSGTLTASGDTAVFNFTTNATTLLSVFANDAFEQKGCAFSIGGSCIIPTGGPDDFSVKSITVQNAVAVPLPAGWLLLLSGLGSLGALGAIRRGKARA